MKKIEDGTMCENFLDCSSLLKRKKIKEKNLNFLPVEFKVFFEKIEKNNW